MDDHVQIDLEMTRAIFDLSLYCLFKEDHIIGINGSYIDDVLRAGINEWLSQADATLDRFMTTGNEPPLFTFAGMQIRDPGYDPRRPGILPEQSRTDTQ